MPEKQVFCFKCSLKSVFQDRVSFRAECEHCGADSHVCRNCSFYDESAYNECREPSAEKVHDKEAGNVCEYFNPAGVIREKQKKEELLKQAESLFKKKGG